MQWQHVSSCFGLLQVGAQFLALHYPLKLIYIPSPTWANHNKIFPLAGIQIRNYRYYKPSTRGLDYEVGCTCCSPNPPTTLTCVCRLKQPQSYCHPIRRFGKGHATAVFVKFVSQHLSSGQQPKLACCKLMKFRLHAWPC